MGCDGPCHWGSSKRPCLSDQTAAVQLLPGTTAGPLERGQLQLCHPCGGLATCRGHSGAEGAAKTGEPSCAMN